MTRLSLFNSPLMLGFDHFERVLDRASKASAEGYPPYNIEQIGENRLRITLAVAGFAVADLAVQVEDNQLVIRGKQGDHPERVYLHRGIAARQFQRSFVLAEGIEVTTATLDNGLLHIDLVRPVVQPTVRTVEIRGGERPGASVLDIAKETSHVNQTIDIRNISTNDLAALGVQQLAYIKPVLHNKQPAFAIHAADGTLVALSVSRSAAEALVRQNDLDPVSVH